MHLVGIIAEYNPFHTGHIYHIENAKRATHADGVIAVMSGSFVQRGEPAVYDKWTRAFHALLGGVDLVLELPVIYATASAEWFAFGAVETLLATGVTDVISFGSECGDLAALQKAADAVQNETPLMKQALRAALRAGKSYAAAKAAVLSEHAGKCLSMPNDILGTLYLRAIHHRVPAHTIKRVGTAYTTDKIEGAYASAMALRLRLLNGEDCSSFVPYPTETLLPHSWAQYEKLLLYALRTSNPKEFPGISATVAARLVQAQGENLAAILTSAKTKNIAMAAIKRALVQILIQNRLSPTIPPAYLRVLGFTARGAEILKKMRTTATLPIISKPSAYDQTCPIWQTEQRATDIYFMGADGKSGEDIRHAPIRV
ncbi:MAG: nucleotidyltransferase family protein [Clostridia bacterium]|nr:nucleotidyltransferase family protein [Clostridia bacterium]